jgi:hypothetical protein
MSFSLLPNYSEVVGLAFVVAELAAQHCSISGDALLGT